MRGGGIHATSSTLFVYQPGTLQFINKIAENGSGLYLEVNAKLYVLKSRRSCSYEYMLILYGNHAKYNGALYIADDTNSGSCTCDNECFIQTLAIYQMNYSSLSYRMNIFFSGNTANNEQGANIFGGLLDRCVPSLFAEVYQI